MTSCLESGGHDIRRSPDGDRCARCNTTWQPNPDRPAPTFDRTGYMNGYMRRYRSDDPDSNPSFTGDDIAWQAQGACVGLDAELWFPEHGQTCAEAKAVCATCPVTTQCLEYALEHREKHGVWGGMSEKERRRIRGARRRGEAA